MEEYNQVMDETAYIRNLLEVDLSNFDLETYFLIEEELKKKIDNLLQGLKGDKHEEAN